MSFMKLRQQPQTVSQWLTAAASLLAEQLPSGSEIRDLSLYAKIPSPDGCRYLHLSIDPEESTVTANDWSPAELVPGQTGAGGGDPR